MQRACFDCAEDYVAWMQEPTRVVHVEWRKVRHEKSRGYTSHSWLELRLLDGTRMRVEIYADQGYTELLFDPRRLRGSDSRFFDSNSTIYDGRVATANDLSRPLTAESLRQEAQALAQRQYSLSEFNCHHFVLELWNSLVVSSLRSQHYPDRAKVGLLWGVEEMVGTWLQGIASVKSVGAAAYANEGAGAGGGGGGEVFVLETTGPLRQADLPGRDFFGKNTLDCAWAGKWLPGVEEHCALRLVERIRNFNLAKVAERLDLSLPKASWTLGSVSVTSTSLAAQEERCFLALRGKELRLAVSVALGSQRLLLLSENLLQEEESGSWHARLRASSKGAHELAEELQEDLQVALRRSEWRPALNAWNR
ncbi:unnamed protein product [Effrenium voratum]|uniref:Uncharacterized protein n=1 Tax=Effrenium voratum TaxID=2562239 RepID=A0AA36NB33_9DINO|nr:unnamed protein product [Effrenium voratum]